MESATTLPADGTHKEGTEPHFALELLGLIARIIVTALLINIVFAGIVLLVAGQAEAGGTQTSRSHNPTTLQQPSDRSVGKPETTSGWRSAGYLIETSAQ